MSEPFGKKARKCVFFAVVSSASQANVRSVVQQQDSYIAIHGDQIRRPASLAELGAFLERRPDGLGVVLSSDGSLVSQVASIYSRLEGAMQNPKEATGANAERLGLVQKSLVAPQVTPGRPGATTVINYAMSSRILVLEKTSVGSLASLDFARGFISWSAIDSLVCSIARQNLDTSPEKIVSALRVELAELVTTDLHEQYQTAFRRSRRVLDGSADVDEASQTATGLGDLQLHASGLLAIYRQYGDNEQDVLPSLNFVLSTTLSLSGNIQSNIILRYQRSDADYQDELSNRAAESDIRASKLTNLAAVALLPSLWFSFLGANVFPSSLHGIPVTGGVALIAAVVGGVVSGFAGYGLIQLLTRSKNAN